MHVCLTITIKEEAAKNLEGNSGVVCGMSWKNKRKKGMGAKGEVR